MSRKILSVVISLGLMAGLTPLHGQDKKKTTPKPAAASQTIEGGEPRFVRPETPEQRKERLGTIEDPGPNPDPDKIWWRFGKPFKIQRFDRKWAVYSEDPRFLRPFGFANFTEELYQENDKYVWVWMEEIDEEAQKEEAKEALRTAQYRPVDDAGLAYFEKLREDFKPIDVQKSDVRVKFEESSEGLPAAGSWRNSLDVGDMNGDGFADLILPPQRGPVGTPSIFLGDGKGGWKQWKVNFPRAFNYGSVAVADFNKDKHLDIAAGIHLTGLAVFLGDGKGNFRESSEGLPKNFPTRRIRVTDIDRDGWMDIVTISEGPVGRGVDLQGADYSNLRGYLNKNKGQSWDGLNISELKHPIGGDWLSVGNLNGDKYPDFIGASVYFNGVSTMWVSKDTKSYELLDTTGFIIPFRSYYHANTVGPFSSKDRDDAVVAYVRLWPQQLDPEVIPVPPWPKVVGLDRISYSGSQPKRTPILRWEGTRQVPGLGRGDFDADGKQDILYTRFDPREAVILVGDGAGNFKRAAVEGLNLSGLRNYDVTVADVNNDKRPDVIVMYESESSTAFAKKNGKVQVFLNRGTIAAP